MKQNSTDSEEKRLTSKQLKAIPFILSEPSIDAAAKKSKVARGTLIRWMRLTHFKKTVEDSRSEIFQEGLSKLKAATDKAAVKMIELLDSADETSRRLAAKDILNFALRALETQDLEQRIERIEELIENRFVS